ncbi:MAG: hypothetical protein JXM73_03940 [Anaerolineae bacterium]|nr:hypothetical protein [Anaerolineae bacterium]
MTILKRTLPAALAIAVGLFVLVALLVPVPLLSTIGTYFIDCTVIIAAFALFLGLLNVVRVHLRHIRERTKTWPYSVLLLIALFAVLVVGLVTLTPLSQAGQPQPAGTVQPSGPSHPAMQWIFTNLMAPIQATLGALLAFLTLTAAYRLFRLRNAESALLLLVALLVLAGQASFGLLPVLPQLRDWILDVPALAGMRGILLGVALGTVLTGIRLLLGVERPYGD